MTCSAPVPTTIWSRRSGAPRSGGSASCRPAGGGLPSTKPMGMRPSSGASMRRSASCAPISPAPTMIVRLPLRPRRRAWRRASHRIERPTVSVPVAVSHPQAMVSTSVRAASAMAAPASASRAAPPTEEQTRTSWSLSGMRAGRAPYIPRALIRRTVTVTTTASSPVAVVEGVAAPARREASRTAVASATASVSTLTMVHAAPSKRSPAGRGGGRMVPAVTCGRSPRRAEADTSGGSSGSGGNQVATGMQSVCLASFCSPAGERSTGRCVTSATNMPSEAGGILSGGHCPAHQFPHRAASSCPGSPASRPPCRSRSPAHGSPARPRSDLAHPRHRCGWALRRGAAGRPPGRARGPAAPGRSSPGTAAQAGRGPAPGCAHRRRVLPPYAGPPVVVIQEIPGRMSDVSVELPSVSSVHC